MLFMLLPRVGVKIKMIDRPLEWNYDWIVSNVLGFDNYKIESNLLKMILFKFRLLKPTKKPNLVHPNILFIISIHTSKNLVTHFLEGSIDILEK